MFLLSFSTMGFTWCVIFQLPDQWPRNMSLPTVAPPSGDPQYQSCSMYIEPTNHSWGTKDCIYSYEFHVDGLEWTVVSEVSPVKTQG